MLPLFYVHSKVTVVRKSEYRSRRNKEYPSKKMAMPITFKVHRHLDDILMAFELNKNNIYILSIVSKWVNLLDNGHLHRSALIKTQLCFGTIKNRRQ